jgi:hypothetical protein
MNGCQNNISGTPACELKTASLPGEIRQLVEMFAERLMAGLGDNLRSITVVGSALTDDFDPRRSDINTVLVVREQTTAVLNALAALTRAVRKKKIATPLLMTASYIERSRDVFGVEFLDFQLTHQTVLGDDPFATLNFNKQDVRLQCERELKATLIRLRQGYIACAAKAPLVRDILISTAKGLSPLLRAMLWLKDVERPGTTTQTLRKAADVFSLDVGCVQVILDWRQQKRRIAPAEVQEVFAAAYGVVERLSLIVDELAV